MYVSIVDTNFVHAPASPKKNSSGATNNYKISLYCIVTAGNMFRGTFVALATLVIGFTCFNKVSLYLVLLTIQFYLKAKCFRKILIAGENKIPTVF